MVRFAASALGVVLLAVSATTVRAASAESLKDACIEASENAQQLKDEQKLVETRRALLDCARDACPGPVKKDCHAMLDDVTQRIPTIVVRARGIGGEDIVDAQVSIDARRVAAHLDGAPIEVNPGAHTLRVETAAGLMATATVVLAQGEHNRLISVDLAAPPVERGSTRGLRIGGIVVGVAGLASIAVGSALGAIVIHDKDVQVSQCGSAAQCADPRAALATHGDAVTASTASTVLFIAGGALIVTAIVLMVLPGRARSKLGVTGLSLGAAF